MSGTNEADISCFLASVRTLHEIEAENSQLKEQMQEWKSMAENEADENIKLTAELVILRRENNVLREELAKTRARNLLLTKKRG